MSPAASFTRCAILESEAWPMAAISECRGIHCASLCVTSVVRNPADGHVYVESLKGVRSRYRRAMEASVFGAGRN
jgi:hypothetical protein